MERENGQGILKTILTLLLIVYSFFVQIEGFLGSRFESAFQILQYVLVVVLLVSGSVLRGRIRFVGEKRNPVLPFVFLLGYLVLSLLWTNDYSQGSGYILSLGLRLLMIILAFQLTMEAREIRWIFLAMMLGTVVLAVMVMGSSVTSSMETRTSLIYNDTAFDTNNLSGYLAIGLALLLNYRFRNRALEVVRYIGAGLSIVAILMTSSRGGAIAMVGAILATGFVQRNFRNTVKYLLIVIAGGALLLFLMRQMGVSYVENLIDRFLNDPNGSGQDRLIVWRYSLQLAKRWPIFGYGIGSSFPMLQKYYRSEIGTHNVYLTFLLDGGVVGLWIFLLCLFRSLRAKRSRYTSMAKIMIVAAMIVSFFLDTYNKKILWLPLFFFALTYSVQDQTEQEGT